jgi:hypothetical protein
MGLPDAAGMAAYILAYLGGFRMNVRGSGVRMALLDIGKLSPSLAR